jgi:hypothetical protein
MRILTLALVALFTFTSVPSASAYNRYLEKDPTTGTYKKPVRNNERQVRKPVLRGADRLRNENRRFHIKQLTNAFNAYLRANKKLPFSITVDVTQELCSSTATDCTGFLDIRTDLKPYLDPLPQDPLVPAGTNGTGFTVKRNHKNQLWIYAIYSEGLVSPIHFKPGMGN